MYRRTAWYNQTPEQIEKVMKRAAYWGVPYSDFHYNKNVNPDGTRTLYHICRVRDEMTVRENTSHPDYERRKRDYVKYYVA